MIRGRTRKPAEAHDGSAIPLAPGALPLRREAQLFAVFGDGAPGDGIAARDEQLGQFLVAERLLFGGDQLAQRLLHRTGRVEEVVERRQGAVGEQGDLASHGAANG